SQRNPFAWLFRLSFMSAIGTKRTWCWPSRMSAFGGITHLTSMSACFGSRVAVLLYAKQLVSSARECRSGFTSDCFSDRNRNGIQRVARGLNFRRPDGLSPHQQKKLTSTDPGVACRLGAYSIRTSVRCAHICASPCPTPRRKKMTSALQTRQRQAHLDEQQLGGIRAAVRGQVCLEGSPGYD